MRQKVELLLRNVQSVIIGKPDVVRLLVAGLLARGHILIEDVPGVGKTTLARALAKSISCTFRRIQFTPDLLPCDITGVSVFDPETKEFVFKPGPIFANVVLADEINRSTPRTQSALLEAMNDFQVTVDGKTHDLAAPFMVIATQNPLEYTGTYPLPESQLDRFMMKITMGYPDKQEEKEVIMSRQKADPIDRLDPVLDAADVRAMINEVKDVHVSEPVSDYIVEITRRTRADSALLAGASPRASIFLSRAGQALAYVKGRDYVTPDIVKEIAVPVLAHRLIEKRRRGAVFGTGGSRTTENIIRRILSELPVP